MIETYFDFAGNSVILAENKDGELQGKVQLTLIFKRNDEIVTFDKKMIESPEMTTTTRVDFIDVQRFAMNWGEYDLEIQLRDLNDPGDLGSTNIIPIRIPAAPIDIFISDIELVHGYQKATRPGPLTKSGYDLLPMVNDDRIPNEMEEVLLYTEIYNTSDFLFDEKFLVKAYLADTIASTPVASTQKFLRRDTATVIPILLTLPVDQVDDGFYNIIVEAVTKDERLLARQALGVHRQRDLLKLKFEELTYESLETTWVYEITDKSRMYEYIKCLRPIATDRERLSLDNAFKTKEASDLGNMQRYFFAFWENRAEKERESEKLWNEYKAKVNFVQDEFGTRNKRGYETDRGRVYLKYGAPDDITDRPNDPNTYPYAIWRYYRTGQFNNVRFVFYDPSLMGTDYDLLHCEYIPGELNNPNWRNMLMERTVGSNTNPQQTRDRIDDNFENPR